MFSHGSKTPEPQAQPAQDSRPATRATGEASLISADLKVVGDLHSAGDIQVKGTVEGDIRSRSVTIGEGANVQGSVVAEKIVVSGTIRGQLEAPSVTVAKSAKVLGDIVHQTLSIEAGAFLEGSCKRLETKKPAEAVGISPLKTSQPGAESEKKAASAS